MFKNEILNIFYAIGAIALLLAVIDYSGVTHHPTLVELNPITRVLKGVDSQRIYISQMKFANREDWDLVCIAGMGMSILHDYEKYNIEGGLVYDETFLQYIIKIYIISNSRGEIYLMNFDEREYRFGEDTEVCTRFDASYIDIDKIDGKFTFILRGES